MSCPGLSETTHTVTTESTLKMLDAQTAVKPVRTIKTADIRAKLVVPKKLISPRNSIFSGE